MTEDPVPLTVGEVAVIVELPEVPTVVPLFTNPGP